VAKWIDPTCSLLEALVAHSFWRSHLKNLWRILGALSLFVKSHTVGEMAITPSLISKAFALQRPSVRFKSS
jgi:hypothetical protein